MVRQVICWMQRPYVSRSVERHYIKSFSKCHNIFFVLCSTGLHHLPFWWTASLRERKPVCGPAPVGAVRATCSQPAVHPALLGRCRSQEPRVKPALWQVKKSSVDNCWMGEKCQDPGWTFCKEHDTGLHLSYEAAVLCVCQYFKYKTMYLCFNAQ